MSHYTTFKTGHPAQPQLLYYRASDYRNVPFITYGAINGRQSMVPIGYHHDPAIGISVPSSISPRDINDCTHVPFPPTAPFVPSPYPLYQERNPGTDNLAMSSYLSPIQHVMQQFYQLPTDQQEHLLKLVDHPQVLEQQDPDALLAAINLVIQWSTADAQGGSYTIPQQIENALMRRVQRPPAETGPGSRHGCQHWICLWPGCDKETKRRPNATRHLLSHTEAKPEVCTACPCRFRFPQDLHRHQKTKHSVGPKMVFIDHPGGVLCEDPGDSFEPLGLTISIATAILARSVKIVFQALNPSLDTKTFAYYFSFMFRSSPLKSAPNEDICDSTQDHRVRQQLFSNLWMYLPLMVSWYTHSLMARKLNRRSSSVCKMLFPDLLCMYYTPFL